MLTVLAEAANDDLQQYLAGVRYQRDTPVVSALCPILLFMEYHDDGILYVDDACIVSRSPRGLDQMMAVFVEVFGALCLTVSESKIETMDVWMYGHHI